MMSNTGEQQRNLPDAIRHLWKLGKFRAYYRGLSVRYMFMTLQIIIQLNE